MRVTWAESATRPAVTDGGFVNRSRALHGMSDAGCAVFLRGAQMFWPEAGPYIDAHAGTAARRVQNR
jgi:hypothetical protein